MPHAYLNFSDSTNYPGFLVVGTSSNIGSGNFGNGLTNKNVKIVEIPSTFEEKTIAEVGEHAFRGTNIESIFIPKTIKMLGNSFFDLKSLKEVRFEEGSELEKMGRNTFYGCSALTKIDIPSTLKTVVSDENNIIFGRNTALECFSYLGSSSFTSSYFFTDDMDKVIVHVSKSYPYNTLGQKSVTKDSKTCGVSNRPFSKTKANICTVIIRYKCSQNYIRYMIFIVLS